MMSFLANAGPFVWLLLVCSVLAVGVTLERIFALRRSRVLPVELVTAADQPISPDQLEWFRRTCHQTKSPLGRILQVAADHLPWSKSENESAVEVQARLETSQLERGLVILEIITGLAPLLGLVGTIYGIIPLFGDFGRAAAGDNSIIARGIGLALNKTLVGLLVAMPSLVAWSFFNKRVEVLAIELEGVCDRFLRHQYLRRPVEPPAGTSEKKSSDAAEPKPKASPTRSFRPDLL